MSDVVFIPYLRRLSLEDLEMVVEGLGRAIRSLQVSASPNYTSDAAAALLETRILQLQGEMMLVAQEALRRHPKNEHEEEVRTRILQANQLLE